MTLEFALSSGPRSARRGGRDRACAREEVVPAAMLSLMYVSRIAFSANNRAQVLNSIEATSTARNSALDITGILIVTSTYFAQLLEGPERSVDSVMRSIVADPRHQEIRILARSHREGSRYSRWKMLRYDRESFGHAELAPILATAHDVGDALAIRNLERLIAAIGRDQASIKDG